MCLSETKLSHSHKICTEVSSSVPHFLQAGSLLSPITCRCLLRVLCPVSRPITALVCVLLKDSKRAPVARLGPERNTLLGNLHNRQFYIPYTLLQASTMNASWETGVKKKRPSMSALIKIRPTKFSSGKPDSYERNEKQVTRWRSTEQGRFVRSTYKRQTSLVV